MGFLSTRTGKVSVAVATAHSTILNSLWKAEAVSGHWAVGGQSGLHGLLTTSLTAHPKRLLTTSPKQALTQLKPGVKANSNAVTKLLFVILGGLRSHCPRWAKFLNPVPLLAQCLYIAPALSFSKQMFKLGISKSWSLRHKNNVYIWLGSIIFIEAKTLC